MLKYYQFRSTVKIYDHSTYTKIVMKSFFNFFSPIIRMSRKNANFGEKKSSKSAFYENKKVTKIDDIDANKILVSWEEPYGTKNSFKYFIGYNDNDVIRPLCIKIPQMKKVMQQCPLRLAISNC